jgi:hypothetical protein
MAILRQITLNLLKQEKSIKTGLAARRKMDGTTTTCSMAFVHLLNLDM